MKFRLQVEVGLEKADVENGIVLTCPYRGVWVEQELVHDLLNGQNKLAAPHVVWPSVHAVHWFVSKQYVPAVHTCCRIYTHHSKPLQCIIVTKNLAV